MPNTGEDSRAWLRPELVASWREIAGVLLVLLGPFIALSALAAAKGSQHNYMQSIFSDRHLLINGLTEAGLLGMGLVYLHWRGWKPADLRIRPGLQSSLQALVLDPLTFIANCSVVTGLYLLLFALQKGEPNFFRFIVGQNPHALQIRADDLSWTVGISAMILNAFLEEIVCTSYAFNQFAAKRGPLFALVLVVLLRMACHTYQGPIHMLGIGAVFTIFGLWYWWTRNVWTLIFAHALIDIGSLSLLKLLARFLHPH